MTDKRKDERRPARRPGGDAARPSKGARDFNAPRKFAGGKGAPARFGERDDKSRERRSYEPLGDRLERSDRPARRFEGNDRPRSDRPRFGEKSGFGERKSFEPRGDRPERSDRPARRFEGSDRPRSDRPRFGEKSGFGERKSFEPRGDRPERSDRPARRFEGNDRPRSDRPRFGEKSGFGERKSFEPRGDRPERSDRPARRFEGNDRPRSDRPRFGEKSGFGERKSFESRGDRPERSDRPEQRFKKPAEHQDATSATPGPDRIAKVMARVGVASRRDAEVMISEGRVAVNGKVIDTPVTLITDADKVTIDGVPMPTRERTRLWLYHKPRGLVTTARDPEGRPTVFDNLPEELPRVVAIGRLDINTEGLLLLTNDGGLSQVLAHPDTAWLRRYRVRAYGDVNQAQLDELRNGITIDGMHYGPVEAVIQRQQGDNIWLVLGLREGKNREVKRILEHLGLRVNRLIRVSFGPFQLADLAEGAAEEVRTRVLKDQLGEALALEANVDFDADIARQEAREQRNEKLQNRYRNKEDFIARAPRAPDAPVAEYKREAFEHRSKERAVWRDVETEGSRPKGTRIPRRGADARSARKMSAERVHERAGSVVDPDGRKVKVERIVSKPKLVERSTRAARRFDADHETAGRENRRENREDFQKRGPNRFGDDRPPRRFGDRDDRADGRRSFSDRGQRRDDGRRDDRPASGGRSFGDRDRSHSRGEGRSESRGEFKPRGERSFGDKSFGSKSFKDRSFGDKPAGDRSEGRKSFGGKSFGDKSFGAKPSGGRSFGDRPSGGSRPPRKY